MAAPAFLDVLFRIPRRRRRDALLREAKGWPVVTGRLLGAKVVERDTLAEGGTAFQDRQIEAQYYFTVAGAFFGGHLRSTPLSDSEAHRALKLLPEDTEVRVRHDPGNPDRTATLGSDNGGFPVAIWPG